MPKVQGSLLYYPFGMSMMEYKNVEYNYSFDFNGKETDNETGLQDYGFRIYNKSYGKFLSVDPLYKDYPFYTPYQFASNQPVHAVDIEGLESSADKNPTLTVLGSKHINGFNDEDKLQVECLLKTLNNSQVFNRILNSTENVKSIYIYDKGTIPNIEEWQKNTASSSQSGTIGYIGLPQKSVHNDPSTLTSLVYELTNIQNAPKYENLNNKAQSGNISKEQFVRGHFEIEALAVFNVLEFQNENPEAVDGKYAGFKKFYDMYKNGEEYQGEKITQEVLLNIISFNIERQNPEIKADYEKQYDQFTKKE